MQHATPEQDSKTYQPVLQPSLKHACLVKLLADSLHVTNKHTKQQPDRLAMTAQHIPANHFLRKIDERLFSAGCQPLLSQIGTAYPTAEGARFKVTLGFNTSALNNTQAGAVLVPTDRGSGAPPGTAPGLAPTPAPAPGGPLELPELEVLFSVASTQFLVPMNSTLDYSYFDAPRSACHQHH